MRTGTRITSSVPHGLMNVYMHEKVLEGSIHIITKKREIRSTWGSGKVAEKRVLLLSLEEYPVEVNLEAEKNRNIERILLRGYCNMVDKTWLEPKLGLWMLGWRREGLKYVKKLKINRA